MNLLHEQIGSALNCLHHGSPTDFTQPSFRHSVSVVAFRGADSHQIRAVLILDWFSLRIKRSLQIALVLWLDAGRKEAKRKAEEKMEGWDEGNGYPRRNPTPSDGGLGSEASANTKDPRRRRSAEPVGAY